MGEGWGGVPALPSWSRPSSGGTSTQAPLYEGPLSLSSLHSLSSEWLELLQCSLSTRVSPAGEGFKAAQALWSSLLWPRG